MYSSTCFGRPHAQHQELNNCSSSFWFYRWSVLVAVLLVVVRLACRQVAVTVWLIPDAVDTVVCAPDDGWRYHLKHVEQCPDINKLRNVASCWMYSRIWHTIMNTVVSLQVPKKQEVPRLGEDILASQGGLCTIELVT